MKNHKIYKALFIVASVLVLYTLIGGLYLPIKSGINKTSLNSLQSDTSEYFTVDLYNESYFAKINEVFLLSADKVYYGKVVRTKPTKDFGVKFNIKLGEKGNSKISSLFLTGVTHKGDTASLYLPECIFIHKSPTDTLLSNGFVSTKILKGIKLIDDIQSGFPNRTILFESIRNLLYHVPMWFSMMFLLGMGMIFSILYLKTNDIKWDIYAESFNKIGIINGILGCITGAMWARVTWKSWWPMDDPKLNGVAIGMTMYFAYLILRNTLKHESHQKARISSVYGIMVYPIFIALIAIMPKLAAVSLHPGSGDTVGFNNYDLNNTLRMFFYPAVIGWIGVFGYLAILRIRLEIVKKEKTENEQDEEN